MKTTKLLLLLLVITSCSKEKEKCWKCEKRFEQVYTATGEIVHYDVDSTWVNCNKNESEVTIDTIIPNSLTLQTATRCK